MLGEYVGLKGGPRLATGEFSKYGGRGQILINSQKLDLNGRGGGQNSSWTNMYLQHSSCCLVHTYVIEGGGGVGRLGI